MVGLNLLKPRGEASFCCCCCSFRVYMFPFSSLLSSPDEERRLEIISLMISGRDSKKGTLVATVEDAEEDDGGEDEPEPAEAALAMAMAAAASWNEDSLAAAATASDCWRLAR